MRGATRALLTRNSKVPWWSGEDTALTRRQAGLETVTPLLPSPTTPPPMASPAQMASHFLACVDAAVFSYCIFDFPTIVHSASQLGEPALLERPLGLLMSPVTLIKAPSSATAVLGAERWCRLSKLLSQILEEHEASRLSLLHCARALNAGSELLVPLLRAVCAYTEARHPFAGQAAYLFEELLASGFVSASLFLDGPCAARRRALATLCLAAAREFGCLSMLLAGLRLSDDADATQCPVAVGRFIAATFSRADKRRLDWAIKSRGALRHRLSPRNGWTFGTPPTAATAVPNSGNGVAEPAHKPA